MTFRRARRYLLVFAVVASLGILAMTYLFWPEQMSRPDAIGKLNASEDKGRYLATIGNCRTCHTQKGAAPFTGGVRFQTPYGVLYSTNITPDKGTGIGSWSFEDFYQSMKRGVRPDGTHLYPAFPYTSFARLTDADIASVYLYLKTLEPVHSQNRANELRFPFNLRITLRAWNRLFHKPLTYAYDSARSAEWNRGAYLVQGVGHCGACHTPRNALGAERNDLALTGGVLVDEVGPGKYRQWSAVNLTSAGNGLANWSVEGIALYLKSGVAAVGVVHGPMNEVVMNATRHLEDGDAHAIATYLKSLPTNQQNSGYAPGREQLASGEVIYTDHCGTCHLPTGLGDPVLGVALAGNAIVQSADPSSLINVIMYGPQLPPPPFVVGRSRMKPFGKRLSDQDIADLATYVRASFGNRAGIVDCGLVTRQRRGY